MEQLDGTNGIDDSARAVVTFGKHKGKTVLDVLRTSPGYLVWAHKNVEFFKLSDRLLAAARQLAEEQAIIRAYHRSHGPYGNWDDDSPWDDWSDNDVQD